MLEQLTALRETQHMLDYYEEFCPSPKPQSPFLFAELVKPHSEVAQEQEVFCLYHKGHAVNAMFLMLPGPHQRQAGAWHGLLSETSILGFTFTCSLRYRTRELL